MSNPERILRTLDRHLDHKVSLIIFGRAAIALGFSDPPLAAARTLDVDGIIPLSQLDRFRADGSFWDAQEATNHGSLAA